MRRAARVCSVAGCPVLIDGAGHLCAGHDRQRQRLVNKRRAPSTYLRYGPAWRAISKQHLKDHPYCVICGQTAVEVDHIIPLSQGGTHEPGNRRSLCKPHHSQRTAREGGGFGNPQKVQKHYG